MMGRTIGFAFIAAGAVLIFCVALRTAEVVELTPEPRKYQASLYTPDGNLFETWRFKTKSTPRITISNDCMFLSDGYVSHQNWERYAPAQWLIKVDEIKEKID